MPWPLAKMAGIAQATILFISALASTVGLDKIARLPQVCLLFISYCFLVFFLFFSFFSSFFGLWAHKLCFNLQPVTLAPKIRACMVAVAHLMRPPTVACAQMAFPGRIAPFLQVFSPPPPSFFIIIENNFK